VLTGAVIPVSVAGSGVLVPLVVLLALVSGTYSRSWRALLRDPVAVTALLLFAWMAFAISYSQAPLDESLRVLKKYRELLFLPLLLPLFLNPRWRRLGMHAFIAAMLLTLAASYGTAIGMLLDPATVEIDAVVFKHRITQNTLMALAVFWMALRALRPGRWRRLWMLAIALALVDMFFLVGGRTGHLVLIALAALLLHHRFGWRGLLATLVGGVLAALLLYPASEVFRGRIDEVGEGLARYQAGDFTTSTALRLNYYDNALQLFAQRPLIGFGTGSFAGVYQDQVAGTAQPPTVNPHNEYLMIGVQTGLPGLLLFITLLGLQWHRARRLSGDDRMMARALVLAMAVGCLLNSFLLDSTEGHIYAYLSALLYAPLLAQRETAV
jgi:O-antigen ligase